jgi:hypothetical protein
VDRTIFPEEIEASAAATVIETRDRIAQAMPPYVKLQTDPTTAKPRRGGGSFSN